MAKERLSARADGWSAVARHPSPIVCGRSSDGDHGTFPSIDYIIFPGERQ